MKPSVWRVVWCGAIGLKTHWHARLADGTLEHSADFPTALEAALTSVRSSPDSGSDQ